MAVQVVKAEDVKKWLRSVPNDDFALFMGVSRLRGAHDNRDEFALAEAHEKLDTLLSLTRPVEIDLRLSDRVSIKTTNQKWNVTRWNYSITLTRMAESARFVMWHSEEHGRFLPALFCPDMKTAAFVMSFTGSIRVCPKCDALFIPSAGNVDYCRPAHREAHRMARKRWRDKQALRNRVSASL